MTGNGKHEFQGAEIIKRMKTRVTTFFFFKEKQEHID